MACQSSSYIWIVGFLIGEGGGGTMAGINLRGIWEAEKAVADAADELAVVATRKVGAANAVAKQSVATPQRAFFLAIETQTATGVSGGVDHLQSMLAEENLVAVNQLAP